MSGTQQDEEPDELPEALLDALGLEAQRREYLKRQMLWDANATPELEDLIADDEPVELRPGRKLAATPSCFRCRPPTMTPDGRRCDENTFG
jgi:hypothetical protein